MEVLGGDRAVLNRHLGIQLRPVLAKYGITSRETLNAGVGQGAGVVEQSEPASKPAIRNQIEVETLGARRRKGLKQR